MMNDLILMSVGKDQLVDVAHLHRLAFPASSLTKLGDKAVERYYFAHLGASNQCFFLGVYNQKTMRGFVLSGVFPGVMNRFIQENKWFLVGQVLSHPWLIFNSFFREDLVFGLRKLKKKKPSALKPNVNEEVPFVILSIATHPDYQHFGIGQHLMAEAERHAILSGFKHMSLTVDPQNTGAIQFYKKMGWHMQAVNSYGYIEMVKILENQSVSDLPANPLA